MKMATSDSAVALTCVQIVCELVGLLVQFAVSQLSVAAHKRHRFGGASDLRLEELQAGTTRAGIRLPSRSTQTTSACFSSTQQRQCLDLLSGDWR